MKDLLAAIESCDKFSFTLDVVAEFRETHMPAESASCSFGPTPCGKQGKAAAAAPASAMQPAMHSFMQPCKPCVNFSYESRAF